MSDVVTPQVRSRMMRAVGQRDTAPELAVRAILRDMGVSYRVRNRDLPGSPDIANRSRGWALFVNGCFWHGHRNCAKTKGGRRPRIPASNRSYWGKKIPENRQRDARKCRELRQRGFKVMIVWECELHDHTALRDRLRRGLGPKEASEGTR